ncbi:MAG: hypothetical protein GEU82_04470 [Luteitalea sp.]|nr:hypothetical protein [Luteitalea sp.]
MATLFAPPELLSAYSYAVDGRDPDLPKGTHLRIFAGMGSSFPLTPFTVLKIKSVASEPRGLHVTDERGGLADGLDLSQLGTADVTPLLGDTDLRRVVSIELVPDAPGGIRGARLLDQRGHTVAERSDDGAAGGTPTRFLFSAPMLHKFRLWGPARNVTVKTRSVNIGSIVSRQTPLEGAELLGLPVNGRHTWYFGAQDRQRGLRRVASGAPMRLNAMDRPDGPFDPVGESDEVARVEAMLDAANLAGGLEMLLLKMVEDSGAPPWAQVEKQEMHAPGSGAKQFAHVPRLGNLQLAALDPGVARFLGFADCLAGLPDLDGDRDWNALAVAGLFAIDPQSFGPNGPLGSWLQQPDPDEGLLIDMIARALGLAMGGDVRGEVDRLIADVKRRGCQVRAVVTVTAPVPPWLAPRLPKPAVTQHRWQAAKGDEPSGLYRVTYAFEGAPLVSMAAMAAQLDGTWVTRHAALDVGALPPARRATPRMFGHEQEALSRARELGIFPAAAAPAALLADQDLPDAAGVIPCRFRASDFFGRFGVAADVGITAPPRPAPPKPVLRFHIERSVVDPVSTDARSPGALKMVLAVARPLPAEGFAAADRPRLASAVTVPAISALAAGARPLKRVNLMLDAQTQAIDVSAAGLVEVEFPLPPLLPQETRTLTLSATFTDTAGVDSSAATRLVKVTDMRPPAVVPSGIGLFWASAPGPSPDVELKLTWPAAPGTLYRVYLTDQQALALAAADLAEPVAGAAPSRGRVAAAGCRKVLGGAPIPRTAFRLMTDTPIKTGADGRAVLETTLPRSLETVQFLRVVPISAEGAEAPFDACGIVPVAVPDSRRGAMPRLDGSVDPITGAATFSIVADTFDLSSLRRDEPGLFDGGAIGTAAPEFRIRRAVGAVVDPIYGRIVATGRLERDASAAPAVRFVGRAADDNNGGGLEPFVRYVYWADVRLPPERRLPAGVVPLDPPGGVTTFDVSNAVDQARLTSLPSAPRVLMRAPAKPPAPPAAADITVTRSPPDADGAAPLAIVIADPPTAHGKAVDRYRLAVWSQWPDQPISAVSFANGAPLVGTWPVFPDGAVSVTVAAPPAPIDPAGPITLRVAFVDPLGRVSDVTTMTVSG